MDEFEITLTQSYGNMTITSPLVPDFHYSRDVGCQGNIQITFALPRCKMWTYNCYFDGNLISSNLTYDEIGNLTCEEYPKNQCLVFEEIEQ